MGPMEITIGLDATLFVQELARISFAHEAEAWCSCHPDWKARVAVSDHVAAACEGKEHPTIVTHDPEPAAKTLLRGEAYEAHKAAWGK